MNDHDWKIKVSEDIATIKNDIQYIIKNRCPACKYEDIKSKLLSDRRLIFLILTSFIPMVVGLFMALSK